ncbi:MAG TPA: 2-oxoacid:acceptor oxidoreductase family protein [Candidatus Moranbacteria bacterium]|nr:2-oxoacid:acceptor oxidoreductase family protein [Candidatus Moranbacteria bacterium]
MKIGKDTFEVIFFARGGQGAKTASELIAHAAVREGKFVKAFPLFGPERSGAPTKMFLRVSDFPLRTQEPVEDPDAVVVMDETIMEHEEVARKLDRHEVLIVNSRRSVEELAQMVPDFQGKVQAVDATAIALEITGNPNPNMVLVGKLLALTSVVSPETAAEIFSEVFTEKIGAEAVRKNIAAMHKGHDSF